MTTPRTEPSSNWRRMLQARVVRNTAARTERSADEAGVRISVPTQRPRWAIPPITWIVHLPERRIWVLDELGEEIWDACDGQRTVEEVVTLFAQQHGLTFHESRVSVTMQIRMLVRCGALAIAEA